MSLSEPVPPSEQPPPEVVAIAVALAALWLAEAPAEEMAPPEPGRWRLGGRRWPRATSYRWS